MWFNRDTVSDYFFFVYASNFWELGNLPIIPDSRTDFLRPW